MTLHSGPWFAGSLLGGLDDDDRREVMALGTAREFAAGDFMLREGDGDGGPHVLMLDGLARVNAHGGLLLWIRGPGDLIGARPPSRRVWGPARVTACGEVHARIIDRDTWRRFRRRHPNVGGPATMKAGVPQGLSDDDCAPDAGGRHLLSMVLYALVASYGERTVSVGRRELAWLIMASESSVSRALAELRRYGYVVTDRRSVTVLDASRLYNNTMMALFR